MRARGVRPSASARSSVIISTAAAPSEICDELPAVCTPSSRATGFERRQLLERRLAEALVAVDDVGRAGGLALLVEVGRRRPGRTGRRSGPRPRRRAARCCDDSPNASVSSRVMPHLSAMRSAPSNCEVISYWAKYDFGIGTPRPSFFDEFDADRDPAHHLDAAGDGDVDHARSDERGGEVGGLLARAALGVDGGGRGRCGQAGREPRRAGDVEALLADLADAAADDLADLGRVDAGALDERGLHGAEQVGGVHDERPPLRLPMGVRTASTITTELAEADEEGMPRRVPSPRFIDPIERDARSEVHHDLAGGHFAGEVVRQHPSEAFPRNLRHGVHARRRARPVRGWSVTNDNASSWNSGMTAVSSSTHSVRTRCPWIPGSGTS